MPTTESTPKKERPQNKNLRSFAVEKASMSPEEWSALQRSRALKAQEKRKNKYALARLIQSAFKTKVDQAVISEIVQLLKLPEDSNGKTKADVAIIGVQIQRALQGDKDARDWLFMHGYPEEYECYKQQPVPGVQVTATQGEDESAQEDIHIHLVRGQKPETVDE